MSDRLVFAAKVATLKADDGLNGIQIAKRLGLSKSYVYELLNDPEGERVRARKLSYAGKCVDCGGPTDGSNGPRGNPKRCAKCEGSRRDDDKLATHSGALLGHNQYSDEQLIAAVKRAAEALDGKLSATGYDNVKARLGLPSRRTLHLRFGQWNDVREAAGFARVEMNNGGWGASREDCVDAVARAITALGPRPIYDAYDLWARSNDVPSGSTVRARLGGWWSALQLAEAQLERKQAA